MRVTFVRIFSESVLGDFPNIICAGSGPAVAGCIPVSVNWAPDTSGGKCAQIAMSGELTATERTIKEWEERCSEWEGLAVQVHDVRDGCLTYKKNLSPMSSFLKSIFS